MSDKSEYTVQQRLDGFEQQTHEVDVCVVGGGMAGMIAAISAARGGAKVALVHDRPVLGGNASSEVRMWICGAHGRDRKEAGILEEIQLENCYRNPRQIYSVWDSVLFEKAAFCKGLKLLLNCTCNSGKMDGDRLRSITAWQLTTQTWHTITAKLFIDCSGDSVLAPITGALIRSGREGCEEFGEDIEPLAADNRTMGNTLLVQMRQADEPQPFTAPKWAYRFTNPSDLPNRCGGVRSDNFWWMEVGGLSDTIRDAEAIRDELAKIGYGVVDYLKNYHPKKAEHENWTLEWMGMLPGKRENRRYVGDHILTQNEVRAEGRFDDIVAYGGWSMDDHHPAGLAYPGYPTVFHPAPSPFGIPYRCLYSRNIPNLMFAGRNISTTHAALSSTRVMGTCSLLGQAAGTAAAMCVQRGCEPRDLLDGHMGQLQQRLMDDDQWLPGLVRGVTPLTRSAQLAGGEGVEKLRDGHDRPAEADGHAWEGKAGDAITLSWSEAVAVGGLRIVFDSDLNQHKRMPCSIPLKGNRCGVPASMVRRYRVEAQNADGSWRTVCREEQQYQRLVRLPLAVKTNAIRVVPEETWGDPTMRIFSLDVLEAIPERIGQSPEGEAWGQVVARTPKEDLVPPQSADEKRLGRSRAGA
jgi:FAD dependent oxidoreductase